MLPRCTFYPPYGIPLSILWFGFLFLFAIRGSTMIASQMSRSSVEAWAHASSVCQWALRQSLPGRSTDKSTLEGIGRPQSCEDLVVLDVVGCGSNISETFRNQSKPYLCVQLWCQYGVSDVSSSKNRKSMSCHMSNLDVVSQRNWSSHKDDKENKKAESSSLSPVSPVPSGCWSFWRCALSRRAAASRPASLWHVSPQLSTFPTFPYISPLRSLILVASVWGKALQATLKSMLRRKMKRKGQSYNTWSRRPGIGWIISFHWLHVCFSLHFACLAP